MYETNAELSVVISDLVSALIYFIHCSYVLTGFQVKKKDIQSSLELINQALSSLF